MFLSNNVIELKREKAQRLGKVTVFAAPCRTPANELAEFIAHDLVPRLAGLQGILSLELHQFYESSQASVFIQVLLLIGCQCAFSRFFSQLI